MKTRKDINGNNNKGWTDENGVWHDPEFYPLPKEKERITKRGLERVLRKIYQGAEIQIQKITLGNLDGMVSNKYFYSYYVEGTLVAHWNCGTDWKIS